MAGSVTTMQLLLSAVLLCGMTVAAASTPIHPTTPTAYTAVSNTTIVQNGQTLNLQQTVLYASTTSHSLHTTQIQCLTPLHVDAKQTT